MVNLGNTCFMNSMLQSLYGTAALRNRVLSFSKVEPNLEPVASVLQRYMKFVWSPKFHQQHMIQKVNTDQWVYLLNEHAPHLGGFRQQDTHEFLMFFLNALRDEAQSVLKSPKTAAAYPGRDRQAASSVRRERESHTLRSVRKYANTYVDEIFGSLIVSEIECTKCQGLSHSFEPTLCISMEIPTYLSVNNSVTLAQCLNGFTSTDTIDEFECLNCTLIAKVSKVHLFAKSALKAVKTERNDHKNDNNKNDNNNDDKKNEKDTSTSTSTSSLPPPTPLQSRSKEDQTRTIHRDDAKLLLEKSMSFDIDTLQRRIDYLLNNDPNVNENALYQATKILDTAARKRDSLRDTFEKLNSTDALPRNEVTNRQMLLRSRVVMTASLEQLFIALSDLVAELDILSDLIRYLYRSAKNRSTKSSPRLLKSTAKKRLSFHQQPTVLILHAKRFRITINANEKLTQFIQFPYELDLSPWMSTSYQQAKADGLPVPQCRYELYGMVVHQGKINSGHYIAYVLKNSGWWRFSDTHVKQSSFEQVSKEQAYCLFYRRIG